MPDLEIATSEIFKRFWSWRLQNAPEFATTIGVHIYDDRLDEMSLASYLRRQSAAADFLTEINSILSIIPKTSSAILLDLELLKQDLEGFLKGQKLKTYLCPLNQLEGLHVDFPRLISRMKASCIEDFEKILQRFRMFPQQVQEQVCLLQEGMRLGITMHKTSICPVVAQLREMASLGVENTAFFKPFRLKAENVDDLDWKCFVEEAKTLISRCVLGSFLVLADFLEKTYFMGTRKSIAISSVPNGAEIYKECLSFHTSMKMTAEEIHDVGKREVSRITGLMEKVREQVCFQGDLPAFRKHLRSDPKFKFRDENDIISHYHEKCEAITHILPSYFANIPKSRYELAVLPKEIAGKGPGAFYSAPAEGGSHPGIFYINSHLPETRNRYETVALCLHEAEPGHHLQSALTMESKNLVNFRRFVEDRKYYEVPGRFSINTAYVEGWALYCEYLGEEMGLYKNPYDMFGRLSHEMLRSCRLVVDTGIHAMGWSREQAIEYVMDHTVLSDNDVANEIDRYITWPGQACAYKIGELKIKELRNMAEKSLGDKFDVRKFHDFVACMGGVPLTVLEKQVEAFIRCVVESPDISILS